MKIFFLSSLVSLSISGAVLRDTLPLNDYWRLSEGMENLQLKSVVLSKEMSNVKASLNEPEASIPQRPLQYLLATRKLAKPIPDGFYSITPRKVVPKFLKLYHIKVPV